MGNCVVLSKKGKVLRVVKTDGTVLEFRAPTQVKDILANFSVGSGICVSKQASEQLSPNHELKLGKIDYMIPLPSSARSTDASSSAGTSSMDATGRIKIVITKKQLQELLTKQLSVQEVLSASSGLEKKSCYSVDYSISWKPRLESIPEGSE